MCLGLAGCGGSDRPPTQPTGKDSVSTTVGPSGGVVTTPSGQAGVQIPAGALGSQATITVTRLPTPSSPGQGPLQTSLNQYGPYYEVSISPANAQFGDSVRVGVCQVTDASSPFYAPEATHNRLRLAHTVGSTTEILEPVSVNDFLRCTNVTADAAPDLNSSRFARALAAFGKGAGDFISPRSLYAAHGGLGGKVKSFSPFGAVDPFTGLSIGPEFGIASASADEDIGGVAFDGTNYLVALEPRSGQNQVIEAQLISGGGSAIGGRTVLASPTVGFSRVAFDGTNYLVIWSTGKDPNPILGQFVSKTGALVGSVFTVVPAGEASPSALVFGGGTYYLAYVRPNISTTGQFRFGTFGKRISPAGVVGAQAALSSANTGDGFNNVAFDGTNFLIVYTEGGTVKGKFVSSDGTTGQEVTIIPPSNLFGPIVTVAFNGTNYLVSTSAGKPTLDAVSQLLSPAGTRIGGTIGISTIAGVDEYVLNTTATGSNFIVSYIDSFTVISRASVRARFVSGTGATRGPAFTIASPASGRIPIGAIFNFDGSKYLALLLRGIPSASDPQNTSTWTQADIYSVIVTATIPP